MDRSLKTKRNMPHKEEVAFTAWHTLENKELFDMLQTSLKGLSEEQAAKRQAEFGKNVLPGQKAPKLAAIILHQFLSPLIYVLLAAGAISIALGEAKDAVFIFAVVLLNAAIGSFQEWRAETGTAALQKLLKVYALVRRGGVDKKIAADDLVPGDVVLLESGGRVPADLRLIQANNLLVDESFLTGESTAVEKNAAILDDERLPVSERANMVFAGSTVMSGRCVGVVVATGHDTEVGKIAKAVTAAESAKPPLVLRMERFARQVSIFVFAACGLLIVVGTAKGMPLLYMFFLAVALAVSAIPEGLPVAMTVALSIATSRMAKRNVIVRRLAAVEGLGSCTFIGSDKTGTLTVNQQTVKQIFLPFGRRFLVSGEGYSGTGEVSDEDGKAPDSRAMAQLEQVARAAVLCNEASLVYDDNAGEWKHHGDAVDVALLAFGYKAGMPPEQVRGQVSITGEIPFESERRYAATFYGDESGTKVAVKGAVETVLNFCGTMLAEQGIAGIDSEAIENEARFMAEKGYRVIAVAAGEMEDRSVDGPLGEKDIPQLTFLALVGLIDPLRPEALEAVRKCREAGVEVAMITGDHPATAFAIARELGIADSNDDIVTGAQLEALETVSSPEFLEKVKKARVFARVTPLQKLYIVDAMIRLGHFVAVTGDGVNDAPAMRRANIGVAMGSGTDVAKDASEIIVTDDNFASIEAGIEEGRFAYDNIRKVTYLLIATGLAEVILFALALISGLPLPLLAAQLLWLNLVTNGIQDVALAFEAGESGAMTRPPRRPTEGIFNRLMIKQTVAAAVTMALLAFGSWYWLLSAGWEETAARNMVLLLMVLLENFHVFNCRSEYISAFKVPLKRNVVLVAGVIVAQGIHILSMYIPFMQQVLGVFPVTFAEWLRMIALASIILVVMEIFKVVLNRPKSR